MTTLELRNALRQRNLKVSGLKAELQQRLHDAMSEFIVWKHEESYLESQKIEKRKHSPSVSRTLYEHGRMIVSSD